MNFDLSEVKDKTSREIVKCYHNYQESLRIAPGLLNYKEKSGGFKLGNFTIVDKKKRHKKASSDISQL